MLRLAASRGRSLYKLSTVIGNTARQASSSTSAEGNAVAAAIKAVNESSSASFAAGGLRNIKAKLQPYYPAPAAEDTRLSLHAKLALAGVAGWIAYKASVQATSHEWIVDLSLNILQAAWWISFLSFLPFRSIYVSLRAAAPHTAAPLSALRPSAFVKP